MTKPTAQSIVDSAWKTLWDTIDNTQRTEPEAYLAELNQAWADYQSVLNANEILLTINGYRYREVPAEEWLFLLYKILGEEACDKVSFFVRIGRCRNWWDL